MNDKWSNANSYEDYIGRWSRLVAPEFIHWINQMENKEWLDVGCGTGALTASILKFRKPKSIIGIDPSESHIQFARSNFKKNFNISFLVGNATNMKLENDSIDVIASGLVLNFIDDIPKAIQEFRRVCRIKGLICGYVWDYGGKMEIIRYFWNAAISVSMNAHEKDEAVRFPLCNEKNLKKLFLSAGFSEIETHIIDVPTVFNDFDDYWKPFLSGQAPAPGYCMSLTEEARQELKEKLHNSLPINPDGSIHLIARAIAVKAINNKD